MNFSDLLGRLLDDTLGKHGLGDGARYWVNGHLTFLDGSLMMFLPELVLCLTILAFLFVRLFGADRAFPGSTVALCGSTISLALAVLQFIEFKSATDVIRQEMFTGLLVYDSFTVFFKLYLLLFLVLVVYLTKLSGIPDQEDAPDFYTLLIGSTIGMLLMSSANHLLILFLGVEMTSVPSYAMVGFLKGRRLSSEASLKYVVYGAGAAGVMLYGISLLAGLLGTANLPEMAQRLALIISEHPTVNDATVRTLILAILMVLVGIAFKLSVFPFHFWCPDAFEGAAAEVAGFLSVASKGAAFALLVRFCSALIGVHSDEPAQLSRIYLYLGVGIGVVAAVTATFGNLAAYGQTNMKRMLAYSTIAHAGYMLMAVAAMMVILNGTQGADAAAGEAQAVRCVQGLLFYLWVYLFMNLGAFAIVALIRNEIFSEEISDYAGLIYQSPVLVVAMAVCLFSLVGLPPFGGFFGKLMIFASLYQAGTYHWSMYAVLGIGGLNTAFSLFYYVRVLKLMIINPLPATARPFKLSFFSPAGVYVSALALLVLLAGVTEQLSSAALEVARIFFPLV